jgi:hypothetical protein
MRLRLVLTHIYGRPRSSKLYAERWTPWSVNFQPGETSMSEHRELISYGIFVIALAVGALGFLGIRRGWWT